MWWTLSAPCSIHAFAAAGVAGERPGSVSLSVRLVLPGGDALGASGFAGDAAMRWKTFSIGLAIIGVFVLCAVFAPQIALNLDKPTIRPAAETELGIVLSAPTTRVATSSAVWIRHAHKLLRLRWLPLALLPRLHSIGVGYRGGRIHRREPAARCHVRVSGHPVGERDTGDYESGFARRDHTLAGLVAIHEFARKSAVRRCWPKKKTTMCWHPMLLARPVCVLSFATSSRTRWDLISADLARIRLRHSQ